MRTHRERQTVLSLRVTAEARDKVVFLKEVLQQRYGKHMTLTDALERMIMAYRIFNKKVK